MKIKKIKEYFEKGLYAMGGSVAVFAMLITTLSANTTCTYAAHQPKLPESAKKLRKF